MGVRDETIHIVRPGEPGAAATCGFRLVGRWSGYFAKHGEVRDFRLASASALRAWIAICRQRNR